MSAARDLTDRLSMVEAKRDLFLEDLEYRESLSDLQHRLGDRTVSLSSSMSIVLIKPDAIMTSQARPCLELLTGLGLDPVYVREIPIDEPTVRAMWRYPFRYASIDRAQLYVDILRLGPSLLVVLADHAGVDPVPVSVRVSDFKGRPHASERDGSKLRSILVSPNRFFSLIHASDEPADVVREIGILLSPAERSALLLAIDGRAIVPPAELSAAFGRAHTATFAASGLAQHPAGFDAHPECIEAIEGYRATLDCADGDAGCHRCLRTAVSRASGIHQWCFVLHQATIIDPYNRGLGAGRLQPLGRPDAESWRASRAIAAGRI